MKTLSEIAKAVAAIFPLPETSSGLEVATHRVETAEKDGKLDVVIVHQFPPPAKRFELTIEPTETGWLSTPKSPEHGFVAQAVAMRLQRNAVGQYGPANTSVKVDTGYAVNFVTVLPEPQPEPAAVAAPTPAEPTIPASPAPKRPKALPEASV
jgi:hypothetical protein